MYFTFLRGGERGRGRGRGGKAKGTERHHTGLAPGHVFTPGCFRLPVDHVLLLRLYAGLTSLERRLSDALTFHS